MNMLSIDSNSAWQASFRFDRVKCLIVCRGPVRFEAMQVFDSLGVEYGMLLSEKDSIVYPQTLAPELRSIRNRHKQVHHVPDYIGATREERAVCIQLILDLCRQHRYTHLFAGYGFMAEDAEFVEAVESAGICFVGPGARVIRQAGSKDEAKQLARRLGVSVTPGEDQICAKTLLRKAGAEPLSCFRNWAQSHRLMLPDDWEAKEPVLQAEDLLQASYAGHVELISIEEIQAETRRQVEHLWQEFPGRRIRFKHVGGGGGKGQRVIRDADEIADSVMEVLIESKATGPADNKNFLIEVNIENTRHNEVQLLGNRSWCIELGGRDCSLQMHEQKLQEVSLTEEMLEQTIQEYRDQVKHKQADVLHADLEGLRTMCSQAEKFGSALGLDSVSTFECIVEGDRHYFMEVNTRIQVEHRITEMVYALEFSNPDDPNDKFICESLVAAMLLVACHRDRLPRPTRIPLQPSAVEARINATNAALIPHAGGILRHWSRPTPEEIRDDQGIGIRNPDTGLLQPYHLAGAYDSNVALSITHGNSRQQSLERLAELLRTMELRGVDLQLNTCFHYGLIHWLLGQDPMLKPNTRFVQSYLALAGRLKSFARRVNHELAWEMRLERMRVDEGDAAAELCREKMTLLIRPLKILLEDPHLMMGWLAPRSNKRWDIENGGFRWLRNPLEVLADLYHFLRLEPHPGVSPAEQIWEDDRKLLDRGLSFYHEAGSRFVQHEMAWEEMDKLLSASNPPRTFKAYKDDDVPWDKVRAAHRGFQLGLDLLQLPVAIGKAVHYYAFSCNDQLEVEIPEDLRNPETISTLVGELAPPPVHQGDEVLSWSGGTFFARETPDAEPFVQTGDHVEKGDVIGLLEVMKMFNPVRAEFSGTVREISVDGSHGINVTRGQRLFTIDPDVPVHTLSEEERMREERETTLSLMSWN